MYITYFGTILITLLLSILWSVEHIRWHSVCQKLFFKANLLFIKQRNDFVLLYILSLVYEEYEITVVLQFSLDINMSLLKMFLGICRPVPTIRLSSSTDQYTIHCRIKVHRDLKLRIIVIFRDVFSLVAPGVQTWWAKKLTFR